jgi:hypothetical protein
MTIKFDRTMFELKSMADGVDIHQGLQSAKAMRFHNGRRSRFA